MFSFEGEITQDTTLYANWMSNDSIEYTVTFQTNGGSPTIPDRKVKAKQKITPPDTPTKAGYHFENWYGDKDFIQVFSFDGKITQDTTLYAGWERITYTVTFDSRKGSEVGPQTVNSDSTATEPEPPTREGYRFSGWYTNSTTTAQQFNFEGAITQDTTLYARWIGQIFAVSFNSRGGSAVATQNVAFNQPAGRPEDPTLEGFELENWYGDSTSNVPFDFNTPITRDTTLYAKWDRAVTGVSLLPPILYLTVGETGTLTATITPADAANQAVRWKSDGPDIATVDNGTVTAVALGMTTITVTSVGDPEKTATAQVIVRPAVTFVIDGGSHPGTLNTDGTVQQPTTLEEPANTFAGWFTTNNFSCTDENIFDFDSVITQDITLYGFRYTENPADKDALQALVDAAVQANPTAHLNYINTAAVTEMDSLFHSEFLFNGDLSCWNVANVTTMYGMFAYAGAFNQPLNNWNVTNVTNMREMFHSAEAFNQPLNNWNVGSVTNMRWMFGLATVFNQPLNEWKVENVKNMRGMFLGATVFNQPLNNWNVSSVITMGNMFAWAEAFNQNINNWKVDSIKNMGMMFWQAKAFNQPLNEWNVANVISMEGMFEDATAFNQPLNKWKVDSVTNMKDMFKNATAFNQDINNWNVENVTNMQWIFWGAKAFNQPLNKWNVANVTNMYGMFEDAIAFNQDISNWNVANVRNMAWMFDGAKAFGYRLQDWDEHLRDDVFTIDMFTGTKTAKDNNLPSWYKP